MNKHRLRNASLFLISLCALTACSQPASVASAKPGLASVAALADQAPSSRTLTIQSWQTAEGARVLFMPAPELAMFDLRLTFAAGSSQDGALAGTALLTNAMLNEGSPGRDVSAIAEDFENLGAEFTNGAYRDMAVVGLRSLSTQAIREQALERFLPLLNAPTFPDEALARIKNQLLTGFEFQQQNPSKLAQLAYFNALYGQHPYAHPSDGTKASISKIQRQNLLDFYQNAYSAPNAVLALVGDLTEAQARAMADAVSKALPKGAALAKPRDVEPRPAAREHIEFAAAQTHILLGQLGIERNHPDYAALYLGNQIFGGGGFGSRLMEEVREKRGLSYGIYSGFSPMQARGPFSISVQTRADQSEGSIALIKSLLADFLRDGPTEQELANAKRELTGSFPLSTASNSSIVAQLGMMGFYNLPLNWLEAFVEEVNALSAEQVKAAMQRHLQLDQLTVITVGPSVTQRPLPEPSQQVEGAVPMPEH